MFLEKLKCSHCEKKSTKRKYSNTHKFKNLNGVTNLKSWAKSQKFYVKNVQNKKSPCLGSFYQYIKYAY